MVEPQNGNLGTWISKPSLGGDAPLMRNLWEQELRFYCAKPPKWGAFLSMTLVAP